MRLFAVTTWIVFINLAFSGSGTAMQPNHTDEAPWVQWGEEFPAWVENTAPFRVIGNIYYVGTKGLSSFLITSDKGYILLDGGLPQNASMIAENIRQLGFNTSEIIYLLNSHAHFDHSGGLQTLKEITGARLVASEGDRSALEGGFYLGSENNINYSAPPVHVDQIIEGGETITLGNTALTARITPGHTRGCTSWTMTATEGGKNYDVLFFCSASVAGNSLVPPQYEGIVEDYKHTFESTRTWRPDVLLVNHPFYFNMEEKRAKQSEGNPLAFVDRTGFQDLMRRLEANFTQSLKEAMDSQAPSD